MTWHPLELHTLLMERYRKNKGCGAAVVTWKLEQMTHKI